MRFQLDLVETDRRRTPVVVETEAATRVEDLARGLAGALGADGARTPTLHDGARALDGAETLAQAGIVDGASLGVEVRGPDVAEPAGLVEVRVVGGEGAGVVHRLTPGEYVVGPDARCRVRVGPAESDPEVAPAGPDGPAGRGGARAVVMVLADGGVELRALSPGLVLDGTELEAGACPAWLPGAQLAIGGALLEQASPRPPAPLAVSEDGLTRRFNRPPRLVAAPAPTRFRLPRPPGAAPSSGLALLPVVLVPALGAIISVLVTGNWRFIFLALVSPLGALLFRTSSRRRSIERHEQVVREHEEVSARVRSDLEAALLAEQQALRSARPDPATLLSVATAPGDRLWERRSTDADFLHLRVGTGPVASAAELEDPGADDHRRTTRPTLVEVPEVVDVRRAGVVGVAGAGWLARWLVAQAAVLHSPLELRLVLLSGTAEQAGEAAWGWCRWLPHLSAEDGSSPLAVGTTTETVARRVTELLALVQARSRSRGDDEPDVLVVVDGARRLRSLPGLITVLRDGPAVGVHALCLDEQERWLPEECGAVVVAAGAGRVRLVRRERVDLELRADSPGPRWFEVVARALAPLRAVGDDEGSGIPTAVRLVDLLGLDVDDPSPEGHQRAVDAVRAGWVGSPRSTGALLGAGLDGPFVVDLVRDGPHSLVAGTTGSGKSELLQTLVASLAVVNRPDEMTFVLVDYKGGAAFAEAADLPHTVGMVTDLDAHLVERALTSLGAELRRREHLLAAVGAKDVDDHVVRRAADPSIPPLPRLLLVVDEFASMVRELPEFVTELVNLAQRGRSLGIHLVLATQRPSGAVTSDIRANTNLRVALRMTDAAESRDVIDAPEAGGISVRTPGRAYARLGAAGVLPFQSARVGGRRRVAGKGDGRPPLEVAAVAWADLGVPLRRPPAPPDSVVPQGPAGPAGSDEGAAGPGGRGPRPLEPPSTDLAELVVVLTDAAAQSRVPKVPRPWLPPLPRVSVLDEPVHLPAGADGALAPVAWGEVDLPAQQSREPLVADLDTMGHLHVVGAGQTGRSQALRTLAVALAGAHAVADLHVYGIDAGNGALLALGGLPHTGAVVSTRDPERLRRLLDRLTGEIVERQRSLGARGASDLAELRAQVRPDQRPPHVLVLVDRLESLDRDYASFDSGSYLESLARVLRDGAALGVHVVLAGDRVLASGRYASTTDDKLVLRLNDAADRTVFGLRARDVPEDMPPGRALRAPGTTEVQIAVLPTGAGAPDTDGGAQAAAIMGLAARITARERATPGAMRPRPMLSLPDRVGYEAACAALRPRPLRALVGLGGDELEPLGPDLALTPTFMVGGPPRSGRSTALMTMARSLLAAGTGVVVVAPRRSPLRDLAREPGVAGVITDLDAGPGPLRAALASVPEPTGVVVVDDAELLLASEASADLAALARGAAGEGWALVVGGSAEALGSGIGGWVAVARRNRAGLLLSPQSVTDGEVVGVRLSRGLLGVSAVPGRGQLHLGDGLLVAVQVPETTSPGAGDEPDHDAPPPGPEGRSGDGA